MKRALIVEDWSRFNQAVLDVADGLPRMGARKPPAPKPEPAERMSEPGDSGDSYGLIARQKWRKHV